MQTQAQLPTKTKWEKHHFLHLPLSLHFAHVKTEETQTKVQRKGKSTGSIRFHASTAQRKENTFIVFALDV